MEPTPTKRFVVDILRLCNIKCRFCYHLHTFNTWGDHTMTREEVFAAIDAGKARGNNYVDFTGGEPTLHPNIVEIVEYALSRGIKACIITNGQAGEEKARALMAAGLDDFLVSRHGLDHTHDYITRREGSYKTQLRFLNQISERMSFRFNCVINRFNQGEILEIAKELAAYKPRIVNFINMNPHNDWAGKTDAIGEVIADLDIVEPLLNQAIAHLEDCGAGVNLRYFPMCRINEKYCRCVCNDLHVQFDPYEWDYQVSPKSFDTHRRWGINTSNDIEEKGEPCCHCDLQNICGGVNKAWHRACLTTYGERLSSQQFEGDKHDFYFYRQNNTLCLKERGSE
jgi:MoaA/NifB/PqqE/SkfB family radical SAM enzyme